MIRGKTKADFRARREMVGLRQGDVADALGVTVMSVNRWEREGFPNPPEDAWSLIEEREEQQAAVVSEIAEGFPEGATANITVYRTQADYDSVQELYGRPDRGPFTVANANAFEAARVLDALGVEVRFVYNDEV